MNSASYEYRKISARRGAQLVPIGLNEFVKVSIFSSQF